MTSTIITSTREATTISAAVQATKRALNRGDLVVAYTADSIAFYPEGVRNKKGHLEVLVERKWIRVDEIEWS